MVDNHGFYKMLEQQYFGANMHEREEIEHLPELLQNITLFVDIGAGLGQYSYFANHILQNGEIITLEADSVRISRLRELTSEWQRSSSNKIRVIHAAVSDTSGKATFFSPSGNISGGLVSVHSNPAAAAFAWTAVETDCVKLDSVIDKSASALIKVDVEGAEYRVLLGAQEILQQGKCKFLMEIHPWGDKTLGKEPADIFLLFARQGYGFKRIHHHWLFERSGARFQLAIKTAMIVFIMRREWLKSVLKTILKTIGR